VDDFLLASQEAVARRWHQGTMSDEALVRVGINPTVTLEKRRLSIIENLV
jgi:hypothetical protein